jgi:hypothetical protein
MAGHERRAEYIEKSMDLVRQIGEKAGFAVELYAAAAGSWYSVNPNTFDMRIPRPYGLSNTGTMFGIAREGQNARNISIGINNLVTTFSLYYFPGCCALAISSGAVVNFPNKGINKLGLQLRMMLAGAAGFTGLICTDVAHNTYSIRTIEGAGFDQLSTITNRRTKNRVNLYLKEIP